MFVHKLQVLGILLVILAIINTSTTYVIRDIAARDHTYSIHKVNYNSRGDLTMLDNTCVSFLDYQQNSMETHCSADESGELESPDWSVGYYICGNMIDPIGKDYPICT